MVDIHGLVFYAHWTGGDRRGQIRTMEDVFASILRQRCFCPSPGVGRTMGEIRCRARKGLTRAVFSQDNEDIRNSEQKEKWNALSKSNAASL
jgi:hypothetical protein